MSAKPESRTRLYMGDRWHDGYMYVSLIDASLGGGVRLATAPTATAARKAAIRKLKSYIAKLERMDA